MKSITDIIKPIALLHGSHSDTAQTGRGCFMNVIAYLNGEDRITDQSACVCFVARPIAIWLNDFATKAQRRRMLPLIERAMGSRTDDRTEILRRLDRVVRFANWCAAYAAADAAIAAYAAADAAIAAHAAAIAADAARAAHAADAARAAHAADAARAAADAARAAHAAADAARAAHAADAADAADAARAAHAADAARAEIFEEGLRCLDEMLPTAQEPTECVIGRAKELVEIGAA